MVSRSTLKHSLLVMLSFGLAVGGVIARQDDEEKVSDESVEISLPEPAAGEVDFDLDILPILERSCFECHGAKEAKGGLRLDAAAAAREGGDSGAAFIAGSSAESRLVRNVATDDLTLRMPPDGEGDRLSDEEIGLLRAWIDQGADWGKFDDGLAPAVVSDHWSFQPVRRVRAPAVRDAAWVRNPIDRFVLARLEREGIEPSPEADRAALMRRLYLDLIGLPPTPEEAREFLEDGQPFAYRRLVDRLLASPHFGERWGRRWLDLARYADSDGYEKDTARPHAWRYRDWVIDAINRDLPFDQFVVEQLAGDLLPGATLDQKIATGFHRNTLTNNEGGVDQEEFRVAAVVDRTNTTSSVFLGLTMACAQCHSHKYDPITQREYYQLFAFFNTSIEKNIEAPYAPWAEAHVGRRAAHEARLAELLAEVDAEKQAAAGRQIEWEKRLDVDSIGWRPLWPSSMESAGGATLTWDVDASITAAGERPDADAYTLEFETGMDRLTGLRIEALAGSDLPSNGPGRAENGNFVLSEVKAELLDDAGEVASEIEFESAWADYSQGAYHVNGAIDGKPDTGWAISGRVGKSHVAVLTLAEAMDLEGRSRLRLVLDQNYGNRHTLGRLRVMATGAEGSVVGTTPEVLAALRRPIWERGDETRALVADYFASIDPRMKKLTSAVEKHRQSAPRLPEMRAQAVVENEDPPATHIHVRGDFMRKGREVEPGTPGVFPPLRTRGEKPDRLDLALWIVDPRNPLTGRVQANRVWEGLFGRGLVETSEDFGSRGTPPSHPELLAWLANALIERGWSVKQMIRLVVESATYRQASRHRGELREIDPKNVLLARQNRYRVGAEITRDLYLAAGGLLDRSIGGPSIRPELPAGVRELGYANSVKWEVSEAPERHRRGAYIFFQRTVPYPMLMTFDSPDSNTSCIRRNRSNTPLQALTLLNDPVLLECGQTLGKETAARETQDDSVRMRYVFERCLSRAPSDEEAELLMEMFGAHLAEYEADEESARGLLAGEGAGEDPAREAAWVTVARVIMNLDEFVTRE